MLQPTHKPSHFEMLIPKGFVAFRHTHLVRGGFLMLQPIHARQPVGRKFTSDAAAAIPRRRQHHRPTSYEVGMFVTDRTSRAHDAIPRRL